MKTLPFAVALVFLAAGILAISSLNAADSTPESVQAMFKDIKKDLAEIKAELTSTTKKLEIIRTNRAQHIVLRPLKVSWFHGKGTLNKGYILYSPTNVYGEMSESGSHPWKLKAGTIVTLKSFTKSAKKEDMYWMEIWFENIILTKGKITRTPQKGYLLVKGGYHAATPLAKEVDLKAICEAQKDE